MDTIKISPSLMCADFLHLSEQLDTCAAAGIEYLHMDIMDGHYVPNYTLGPAFCVAVAEYSSIPMDLHLMVENVDEIVGDFIPSGGFAAGSMICFHPEPVYHPHRTLSHIRQLGVGVGVAIDPATPLLAIEPILPELDLLCIMTVNPGYAGQKLVPQTVEKVAEAARLRQEHGFTYEIEVDGNVSWENIPSMISAGAEVLVAGSSSIFDGKLSLDKNIEKLRSLIAILESC